MSYEKLGEGTYQEEGPAILKSLRQTGLDMLQGFSGGRSGRSWAEVRSLWDILICFF